ncbi:MAG TPA: hypothetical protein VI299_13355 [Polyangiales bacterium]
MNLAYAAPSTRHSDRKLILSLLASVVFLVCASVQLVAHASAAPNASSARDAQDPASRVRATEAPSLGPARDTAPADELGKLESEDLEDDAGLHGPVVDLRVRFQPIAYRARDDARAVYADWAHQPTVESALPRGPP